MKRNMPGGNSAVVPPDPMPNSEVKRRSADGSVGSPHARVGNCQALIKRISPLRKQRAFSMEFFNQIDLNDNYSGYSVINLQPYIPSVILHFFKLIY